MGDAGDAGHLMPTFSASSLATPAFISLNPVQRDYCQRHLVLPVSETPHTITLAVAEKSAHLPASLTLLFGKEAHFVRWPLPRLRAAIHARIAPFAMHEAVHGLREREPARSASVRATPHQILLFALLGGLFAAALALNASAALVLAVAFMSVFYVGHFVLRTLAALAGAGAADRPAVPMTPTQGALPIYSVLVPLYREADVVPALMAAMRALEWPKDRLDLKLIVEEDDLETREAASHFENEAEIIVVPPRGPRTKPKALNFALAFARGEYLVIYDAEDRPEADQLKKAHARFQEKGARPIACLQARLNCYNRNRNWLTRLFALDYALWFDFMLPGLERMGLPLPLGGTSNHFRVSVLRHVHAWDAWNVTEDADLGLRLMRHGHRIATLDSTTYEEAAETLGPWLRQRARWLKGYLITFLVHMRVPGRALVEFGAFGVLGLLFFIGGSVLTALVNPVFWILWVIWAATGTDDFHFLFGGTVEGLALFSMIAGNLGCLALWLIAPMRRGWVELAPWALTAPIYWLLISASGWLALYDFVARPFHWHKTPHGASAARAGAP